MQASNDRLGLVLPGGGALAAYQAGFLEGVCERFPHFSPPILTGVSAGAINAVSLASLPGEFPQRVHRLREAWQSLTVEQVFRVAAWDLGARTLRWGVRLLSGGQTAVQPRSLLDVEPLRRFLTELLHDASRSLGGIASHLGNGSLEAIAVTSTRVRTGQSVTWVQGQNLSAWSRSHRVGTRCKLSIDHVLASSALPFLFPAVQLGNEWYSDGGVNLTAPLSPAIHLGADRLLAISTHYRDPASLEESFVPARYPPPAELAGMLLSSVFIDQLDSDALRLERINELVKDLPEDRRRGLRPLRILLVRPSVDLDQLANQHEPELPRSFRFLTRGLGTRQARRNEFLSLLMFQANYLQELLDLGRADAVARESELGSLLGPGGE